VRVESYLICATPRSGTTLLCDLLEQTGVAGRPDSFYRQQSIGDWAERFGVAPGEGFAFERRYLEATIRYGSGDTGMFGMRVMWPSMPEMQQRLTHIVPDAATDAHRLRAAFGTTLYIHLERKDRVAQAISRAKAEQSGLWHRHADGSERELVKPYQAPSYDSVQLDRLIAETNEHEAAWKHWFAAQEIAPLGVTYEELSTDRVATLSRILSALGRDPAIAASIAPQTARLADAQSQQWAERYRAEHDG